MIGRLSDEAVAACVAPALRVIYEGGGWGRQVTAQLVAVVEYVEQRPADPVPARIAALSAVLDELAGNPLVQGDGRPEDRAAAALVAAVGRSDADADAVRRRLRPVLVDELDDELASTMTMMDGFRGRIRDA